MCMYICYACVFAMCCYVHVSYIVANMCVFQYVFTFFVVNSLISPCHIDCIVIVLQNHSHTELAK